MKLFNSLTKRIEKLEPIKRGKIGLYTCGPTVYDHVHIGNLRTYIFEDTLRRVLELEGHRVQHVMNITDVDDKTIKRSREQYPAEAPEPALSKLTQHYEKIFFDDAAQVGINLDGSKVVRATEHIADMQKLIAKIPTKYVADDGVYFDIAKYPDYGVFVSLDQSHKHHRINNDEYDKEHVADFALWKAKEANEPSWDFEIDGRNIAGRPGWHIECSAMSAKYLDQPFDIHTGGVDLKFPHHENEIAQSKSVNGQPLANYFAHGEHLLVEGKKMAKSAQNFYTLEDITNKGFDPLAFRLLILQAHYRSQLNFSWQSLTAAQTFLQTIYAMADRQFQPSQQKNGVKLVDWLKKTEENIKKVLAEDLNTAKAVALLGELADFIESEPMDGKQLGDFKNFVKWLDRVFGLTLTKRQDIPAAQKHAISDRETARKNQDFGKSDKIRADLEKQGIGLNDTAHGPVWFRTA